VDEGRVRVRVEAIVLHELSYVLPRFVRGLTRQDIGARLHALLAMDGVEGDKDLLTDSVDRWSRTPGLGFADAYLAATAARHGRVVYTNNVRELKAQGATVPDPLPS
jgi:predicted nucleic acid-binding protein